MRTVLAHGVFDLLHSGHLAHLHQARQFGDRLVVSVLADRFVTKRETIYKQGDRIFILRSLRQVDEVILCDAPGPELIIAELKPDIYVRGDDYIWKTMPESPLLESLGIKVRYTASIPPHTEDIIARIVAQHKGSK